MTRAVTMVYASGGDAAAMARSLADDGWTVSLTGHDDGVDFMDGDTEAVVASIEKPWSLHASRS